MERQQLLYLWILTHIKQDIFRTESFVNGYQKIHFWFSIFFSYYYTLKSASVYQIFYNIQHIGSLRTPKLSKMFLRFVFIWILQRILINIYVQDDWIVTTP